ncbi:protein FAR1-RELATED SEQUENCE 5-like [Pyrus ussuriensis x Pyrus communis]|uniref:Protein FAR1-RELATED SEQUENCE n=1 Tax=Pyrus ussuriensis x Pyrus communis TaxID=2448454 RepID=A0A5N5FTT7_9ROSA|nr:protein FAR1-RELATED SEQUENCE 5-like [Pyrus ussuriensis x Pyrus communis]
MEIDEGRTLRNFFWVDAKSRRAYGFFGDVIVLDTTFNTNVCGMMFASLLGVKNHSQTKWLFEEMLKAMSGELLKVTDQDRAIAKVISSKLPTTFHCYCIWHISNKFNDKVRGTFKDLHNCIWDIKSKEEFEKEVVGDHNDENRAPPLQLRTPMEEQIAKLYTRFMFKKFQVEELKSLTCSLREYFGHENEAMYLVLERDVGVTKMKRLVVNTTSGYAKCNCKEIEWLQTAKCNIVLDTEGKEIGKHPDNSTVSKRAQFSNKALDLIDKAVMSEEGTTLLSWTFKALNTKLNYLGGGSRSSQPKVLKDLIQVKRKGASKTTPVIVMLPSEMKLLILSLIQCQPKAVTLNLRAVIRGC